MITFTIGNARRIILCASPLGMIFVGCYTKEDRDGKEDGDGDGRGDGDVEADGDGRVIERLGDGDSRGKLEMEIERYA